MIRTLLGLLTALVMLSGALTTVAAGPARAAVQRPIIFVHGFFGSGSQFETQAKRFASNGYPADRIETQDYDSTFLSTTTEEVHAELDRRIARLKAATGADKVELLGHSLGTRISQEYLTSSAARAANVAHYVNIDGATATSPPGGVPTLAIWGEGDQSREVAGAINVYQPGEAHVETATSVASFKAMYEFFTGQEPRTTDVVPESGQITLAGRAVKFPSNAGYDGARLDVYALDPATGHRRGGPVATYRIGGDGAFGPFQASGTAYYEFAITPAGSDRVHHHYFEPFRRTDLGVRLLSSEPGSLVDALIERNRRHVAIIAYRNKEWWGDQGANGDALTMNGTSVLNATIAPRSKRAIALFAYDWRSDRVTDTSTTIGLFPVLPFMSGADIFLPAQSPPAGSVVMETRQRGGDGRTARLVVPDWPSDTNTVTVTFNDYA